MKAYDPAVAGGPWWYESKAKKHYYNGKTTMEFMVEDELNVSDVDQINFVNHHSNYCSLKDSRCHEKGMNCSTAAALFLAGVVANRVNMKSLVSKLRRGNSSRDGIRSALSEPLDELASQERWNASVTFGRQSKAVARAVLAAYFRRDEPETKDLISIFKKKPEVIARCLYELVGETFGIEASDLARKASREDD